MKKIINFLFGLIFAPLLMALCGGLFWLGGKIIIAFPALEFIAVVGIFLVLSVFILPVFIAIKYRKKNKAFAIGSMLSAILLFATIVTPTIERNIEKLKQEKNSNKHI